MDAENSMSSHFEANRAHLRAVAQRMLGSAAEADDAVQEAWLRVARSDTDAIENPGGWLTTVTARVCLNMLRSRTNRREDAIDWHVPDPVVTRESDADPEGTAVIADSVGLALLVVLESLEPAERLAFVLHDMFAVPFDEIATMLERTSESARQLASRARRRVQGATSVTTADRARHRRLVDAFFAAAHDGDLEALVAVLDPDVVARSDGGSSRPAASALVRGARAVAGRAVMFHRPEAVLRPVLVDGATGVVIVVDGVPDTVMGFTVSDGRIVAIDILADPDRLAALDLPV
ncbi:MAG: RNA polymerase sigma factor SigJ [Actinobacteria bacterium]|nr:RNA polymerase sigma factor SigJ [Actinomycetota bacterium]